MPTEGTAPSHLLAADEPTPFQVLNGTADKPLLLVCDHASRRFPGSLGDLGVDPPVRRCHLASDIGAGALTERLAAKLEATAILQQYSRLVIDCNRELLDPGAFLEFGDGVIIPGNRNLDAEQKRQRAEAIYWPYHREIERQIDRFADNGVKPSLYAIHSFTPVMNGVSRPWQIGILWDKDSRIALTMIRELRQLGFIVGDNEPYSGRAPQDFTIDYHAETAEMPHVGIEIRQDLIDDDTGVAEIGNALLAAIEKTQAQLFPTDIATRLGKRPA